MKKFVLAAALIGIVASMGCAQVPEEAVTLSLTVQKDIGELERANVALARQYFGEMKEKINRFVDDTYGPQLVVGSLQRARTLDILSQRLAAGDGANATKILQVTVQDLNVAIEAKRNELLQPITANEVQVVQAIQDSYSRVQNAQAIVSGHLASLRQVDVAQQELLSDVGLQNLRGKFIETTAGLSDDISMVLNEAKKTSAGLDDANASVDVFDKAFSSIEEKIRAWRTIAAPTNLKPGG
jgi:hypothetical protein